MKHALFIALGAFAMTIPVAIAQVLPLPPITFPTNGPPPAIEQQLQALQQQRPAQTRLPDQRPPENQSQEQRTLSDIVAKRVAEHVQSLSCDQLATMKSEPKPEMTQELAKMLRSDPQVRAEFISKVATPVTTKLFECGMIP
ncbi:hypothetical protein GBZ48_22720 [Azospirillum melinis]|uniref:Uncharacterized protein n=1 Tax=Azospirillum melinis TaxID=328839 RepID=A0ABX2KN63_9PROT|nr:hypothetical protein [Azospirillum melinis]MBP2310242.1 hypothetical protein [Azospirillum melinis]NUB02062.1 hypothetical protein [Azospirillum melinis]